MRKIISLIIMIAMLTNTAVIFAEDNKNTANVSQYVIDTISGIGVIDDYYDGDRTVSRGEFAEMIIKLCNMENRVDGNAEPLFYDVSMSNEYYAYIMLAASQGIVEGDENKKFYPNQGIKVADALVVAARTLGAVGSLKNILSANDVIANENLGKNISMGDELTFCGAVQLMFNIFNAYCYSIDNSTLNGRITKLEEKKKFYELYWNMGNIIGGQITANQYTSLDSPNGTANGNVIIGNIQYNIGATNADELLGCKVNAYFIDDDDEKTLVSLDNKSKDSMITIPYEDISDKTTIRNLVYYQNRREKKVDISSSDVIYNAVCSKHHTNEDLRINTGSITLISSENNSKYDVVKVDTYKNMFVSGIEIEDKIIYDKNSTDFVKLEDDLYSVEGISGNKLDLSSISEKSVISVYESINQNENHFIRVVVSNREPVSGKITTYETAENGNIKIGLNDEKYIVPKQYIINHEKYPGKTPLLKSGMNVELYLDAYGMVASAVETNSDLKYGYLIKLWKGEDPDDQCVYFKIYSQDEEFIKCKSKEKMKINGVGMKSQLLFDAANLYDKSTGASKDQLVRYRLNEDGDMCEFEYVTQKNVVPYQSVSNTLVHNETLTTSVLFRSGNKLGGKYILGSDTVIFKIPHDINQEKGFSIDKTLPNDTYLPETTVYNCSAAYKMGAVVCRENQRFNFTDDMYLNVIKSKMEAVNSDGEITNLVEYYNGGKIKTAYTLDNEVLNEVEAGDIVQFAYNNVGEIKGCKPIFRLCDKPNNPISWCIYKNKFDYKSPGTENTPDSRDYSPLVIVYGVCLAKSENIVTVTGFDEARSVYATKTSGNVYIYDTDRKSVEMSSFDAIVESGSIDELTGSVLLTNARNDLGRELYIIK